MHLACVFLDKDSGTSLLNVSLPRSCTRWCTKILVEKLPGRPAKHAPSRYTSTLQVLEAPVRDRAASVCSRINTRWWLQVHPWCTVRFSDRRGLRPSDAQVNARGLVATLSRSKTLGAEESGTSRFLVLYVACFVVESKRIPAGWSLLLVSTEFRRNYALSAPSRGFHRCQQFEPRNDLGSAMQSRLLICSFL